MFKFLSAHATSDVTFPTPEADGDPIALAIVLACVAIFVVWIIVSKKKKTSDAAEVIEEVVPAEAPKAPGAAGQLKLHNVEPKTAAMVMAIVAEKTGKPLNELRFISIKEVE